MLDFGFLDFVVNDVVLSEILLRPFLQVLQDLSLMSFLGETLSREVIWGVAEVVVGSILVLYFWFEWCFGVVTDEEAPGGSVVHVHIQLLNVVVVLEFGSVYSDNISNSLDDWQIFKGLSEEDDVDVVELSGLADTAWVNNFTSDYVSLLSLVWERGIDDDSIEMAAVFIALFGDVVEFGVLVVVL